jgi:REP element-mobilizing transposase RayT
MAQRRLGSAPNAHKPAGRSLPGARRRGRPLKPGAGVTHRARPKLSRSHPVHVTLRLLPGLNSLRRVRMFRALFSALSKARERNGMRICHYSVQSNHLHLIVEAGDKVALSRGIQGLAVRIARRVNRQMGRRGTVFRDRYHARALRTAWQVRIAVRYVLLNARKHSARNRMQNAIAAETRAEFETALREPYPIGPKHCPHIDPYSSALWLVGWNSHGRGPPADVLLQSADTAPLGRADPRLHCDQPEVAHPKTHLLRQGWLSWGRLDPHDAPSSRDAL